jgi:hypothetical protein
MIFWASFDYNESSIFWFCLFRPEGFEQLSELFGIDHQPPGNFYENTAIRRLTIGEPTVE